MPPSSHQKLTIVYSPGKKLFTFLGLLSMFLLAWLGLRSDFYILEVTLVLLASYWGWSMINILGTRSITLYADKIVKTGFTSQTTIPARALVTKSRNQEQTMQFFHGSDRNIKESVKVSGWCLSPEHKLWLETFERNVYRIGSFRRMQVSANSAASVEFEKAVSSFRFMLVLTAVYLLIYVVYATYLHWNYTVFNGYAPNLPAAPFRLLFVAIALGIYLLLRRLTAPLPPEPCTYTVKVQRAQQRAFQSALAANGVAWLGLPLFLLGGNKLDFYWALLIGAAYCYDFYPRLSDWERLLQTVDPAAQPVQTQIPRRSLQVSLALLGGLSLASYAGSPDDFRIRQQDCQDSNGNATECHSGHSSHGSSGSSYHGNTSTNSHSSTRRGGFGFFGGSHSSFGG